MNTKTLYLLIATAMLAVAVVVALQVAHPPRDETSDQKEPLLPVLRDHVNDVSAITLIGADDRVIATLKRGNEGWGIVEKAGYPADVTEIRQFLLKLEQSTLIEPKTTNPKRYSDIGVDDTKDKDAKGVLVEISGLPQPAKLIIGIDNSAGGGGTFVRRGGEAQSWLASGDLTVAKSVAEWERRDLADIAPSRLESVTLTAPDGKILRVSKDRPTDATFKIADVPNGREANSVLPPDTLASTLADLKADDAFPAKDMAAPDRVYRAEYVAFDGLSVVAAGWQQEGKNYAQFTAMLDPVRASEHIAVDEAKAKSDYDAAALAAKSKLPAGNAGTDEQEHAAAPRAEIATRLAVSDPEKDKRARLDALTKEVAALNKSFSGWTFVLPEYKFANLTKTMNDMLKPLESKKAPIKDTSEPGAHTDKKPLVRGWRMQVLGISSALECREAALCSAWHHLGKT